MKRSEYIAIGAIGLMLAATFWPRGGEPTPAPNDGALAAGGGFQTLAFENVDECRASQAVTQATCDQEFNKASERSIAEAPKFGALSECQAEYGANTCRPASWNGASVFVPVLAGVLIARSLNNAAQTRSQPLYPPTAGALNCPPGADARARPECAPRAAGSSSGGARSFAFFSTGSGRVLGRTIGSSTVDQVYNARSSFPSARSTVFRSGGSTISSPGTTSRASTTSTVSRGGFGSTGRSMSSGS